MKLPCLWLVLGFVLGVVIQPWLAIPRMILGLIFLAGLPFLWLVRGKKFFLALFTLHLAILGIFYADLDLKRPEHAIEHWTGSERLSLEGIVKTQPDVKTHGKRVIVSFVLASKNLLQWKAKNQREFHETAGDVQVFLFNPSLIPDYGDRLRLWGMLERPKEISNPGEFDYGKYLAQQEIFSIFKGFGEKSIRRLRTGEGSAFLRMIEKWRTAIEQRIDRLFAGKDQAEFNPSAELFKALILGKRKGIPDELRDDFMKTGTSHLLAISGMNITMIAGTFYFVLLLFRLEQKIAAACALVMVMIYVFIAGFGIPVQRAGWMVGTSFLAFLLERERNSLNTFFLAFFLLLIFNPSVLTNLSFQLSFISVFSLIWMLRAWPDRWMWKELAGQTLAVMAGTFPLVIYYFNIVSFSSLLANLGAIPLFDLAMVHGMIALALGRIPWIGILFVKTASMFLDLALQWIHFLAKARWGYYFLKTPSLFHLIFYYALIGIFFSSGMMRRRWILWFRAGIAGLWLATAGAFFWKAGTPDFSLTLLAAGKNEIAHLQFPRNNHWLINTGRAFPSNQGEWLVDPYLRKMGIKHLEAVMMTDFYAKHWGGLPTLVRNFSIGCLFYPGGLRLPDTVQGSKKWRVNRVPVSHAGKMNIGGGGQIEILEVVEGRILLEISFEGRHFLFLPAVSDKILDALKKNRAALSAADVLILPALGKGEGLPSGFFEGLFEMTDPQAAAIAGENEALKNFFQERDIPLYETGRLGALTFTVDANTLHIESFRTPRVAGLQ